MPVALGIDGLVEVLVVDVVLAIDVQEGNRIEPQSGNVVDENLCLVDLLAQTRFVDVGRLLGIVVGGKQIEQLPLFGKHPHGALGGRLDRNRKGIIAQPDPLGQLEGAVHQPSVVAFDHQRPATGKPGGADTKGFRFQRWSGQRLHFCGPADQDHVSCRQLCGRSMMHDGRTGSGTLNVPNRQHQAGIFVFLLWHNDADRRPCLGETDRGSDKQTDYEPPDDAAIAHESVPCG
jgi:hypothetical protein